METQINLKVGRDVRNARVNGLLLRRLLRTLFCQISIFITLFWSIRGFAASTNYAQQVAQSHLFMEPLVWVGADAPSDADSQELLTDVEIFKSNGSKAGFAALEQFLTEHPHSPWAPALEVNMAGYYRDQGRYSLALAHWQSAWNITKGSQDAAGQKIAVQAFAGETRLLASLGRTEELTSLYGEFDALHLTLANYGTAIQNTRDALGIMKGRPGFSYRCGSFALGHLAMALHSDQQVITNLFGIDSPDGGFTMAELLALAKTNGLAVEAVRRPEGALLVTPCVVHWKLNHYAAITEQKGGRYLVQDPTFNSRVWMDSATITAESSGDFILPKDKIPASWQKLDEVACAKIYGKGDGDSSNDPNDDGPTKKCPNTSDCDPPASNDGAGGSGGVPAPPGCGNCEGTGRGAGGGPPVGMPQWYVSEPYITLWLTDAPLRYHQSDGQWMEPNLSYKSRGLTQNTGLGGFGNDWYCDWFEMLQQTSSGVMGHLTTGGGEHPVDTGGRSDYKTGKRYMDLAMGTTDPPGLVAPDGSEDIYGYTNVDVSGTVTNYLLTERVDQYGRVLSHYYYQSVSGVAQLIAVVDLDGRTNTLTYGDSAHPWLVTAVTNAYGQSAHFNYNADCLLTNIVDPQGMSSYFQYDGSEQITNLITLYGTNNFQYFDGTDSNHQIARSLLITEPTGDHQLYAYRDLAPDTLGNLFGDYRLSFYWNRRQYQAVSSAGQADILAMTSQDYQQGSVKQWLHSDPTLGTLTVSDTMDGEADAYDPTANTRPGAMNFTYQGQQGGTISDGNTDALQRVTSIQTGNSAGITITRNTLGRPTSYTYDTVNGHPAATYTNIFDSSGMILQYELGPNSETTRGYGYDSVITNLLISVTNAVGDVLRYTHAPNTLKVTSIAFPGGLVRTNIYYASGPESGFPEMQADLGIRTNWFGWLDGNLAAQTNELGLVTTYTYDNLNRLTSTSYPDGTSTSNIYNNLDIVATKDRLNQWTYYGYNSVRQLTTVTNADTEVTTYYYCGCGSPDEIIRWNGSTQFITLLNYDNIGRLTNASYPDNYQLNYTYDTQDRIFTVNDNDGHVLTNVWYQYGLQNQIQSAWMPDTGGEMGLVPWQLLSRQFDEYGRVTNEVDLNELTTAFAYDYLNRLTSRQMAPTPAESFVYNSRGLTNYTDALGHVTGIVRDVAGRVTAETNANGEVLQFAYNPADELLTLTDGANHATTWGYDQYGRVTNKLDAAGTTDFVYQYDADNRLTNRLSAAKGNTVYKYDPIGNLTNVYYVAQASSLSYAYDGLNRLTNMLDGLGNTAFTWTPGDQLAGENGPWPQDAVSYTYDPNSRQRIGMSVAAPNADAWTQGYTYDADMRLSGVTSAAGTFAYAYAGRNLSSTAQPGQLVWPGSIGDVMNQYDSLGRLNATTLQMPFQQGRDYLNYEYQYGYDASSELTQQVYSNYWTGNYSSTVVFRSLNYSYDNIGQLKTAQGLDADGVTPRLQEQFGYAYDKAWNLTNRTNNALIESFAVNNNVNELSSVGHTGTLTVAGTATEASANAPGYANPGVTSVTVSGTGLSSGAAQLYEDGTWARAGAVPVSGNNTYTAVAHDNLSRSSTSSVTVNLPASPSYSYDANGNLLSDGTRNFAYDCENELTAAWVANSWSNSFVYDGLLRKRIERDYTWNNSAWLETNETRYVYDGYLVVQERNAGNIPQVTYTRGNDLSGSLQGAGGIGGLLARTDMGLWVANEPFASAYYFNDIEGNVVGMFNSNQVQVAQYEYDPFGNMISMSGPLAAANRYRFSSKEWEEAPGMYYYGFRHYIPELDRWPNRDPMGDIGGAAYIGALVTPKIDSPNLFERTVKFKDENDSLSDSVALGDWTQVNGNLFGGIANDPVNKADPFGLDASSYAGCIEKYRNPLTEQLPNAIAESLSNKGSGNGKGSHVPGWVPPAAHTANALGNLAVGSTGRVGIAGVPPHPTTWQHKLLGKWGGKFLGRAAIVLTVAEGFWDLGLLGGCGIAEAIN